MKNGSPAGVTAPTRHQRITAALLDGIIATGFTALFGGLPLLAGLLGGAYLMGRDGLAVGPLHFRSVGKYVMGLRLERLDGAPITLETSVQRNWMLGVSSVAGVFVAVPIVGGTLASLLSFVGLGLILIEVYHVTVEPAGRRWGDEFGHTRVVATGDGML